MVGGSHSSVIRSTLTSSRACFNTLTADRDNYCGCFCIRFDWIGMHGNTHS